MFNSFLKVNKKHSDSKLQSLLTTIAPKANLHFELTRIKKNKTPKRVSVSLIDGNWRDNIFQIIYPGVIETRS